MEGGDKSERGGEGGDGENEARGRGWERASNFVGYEEVGRRCSQFDLHARPFMRINIRRTTTMAKSWDAGGWVWLHELLFYFKVAPHQPWGYWGYDAPLPWINVGVSLRQLRVCAADISTLIRGRGGGIVGIVPHVFGHDCRLKQMARLVASFETSNTYFRGVAPNKAVPSSWIAENYCRFSPHLATTADLKDAGRPRARETLLTLFARNLTASSFHSLHRRWRTTRTAAMASLIARTAPGCTR